MRRIHVVIVSVLMGLAPAIAHEHPVQHETQVSARNPADCYCLARGLAYSEGDTICLSTPEGARMAECTMEQNVMSWSFKARPCPAT